MQCRKHVLNKLNITKESFEQVMNLIQRKATNVKENAPKKEEVSIASILAIVRDDLIEHIAAMQHGKVYV